MTAKKNKPALVGNQIIIPRGRIPKRAFIWLIGMAYGQSKSMKKSRLEGANLLLTFSSDLSAKQSLESITSMHNTLKAFWQRHKKPIQWPPLRPLSNYIAKNHTRENANELS